MSLSPLILKVIQRVRFETEATDRLRDRLPDSAWALLPDLPDHPTASLNNGTGVTVYAYRTAEQAFRVGLHGALRHPDGKWRDGVVLRVDADRLTHFPRRSDPSAMIIRREDIQQIHTLRLRCISETGWAVSAEWV